MISEVQSPEDDGRVDEEEAPGLDLMTHQELDTAFWPRPNRLVLAGTPAARRARYFYTDRESPEILEERKRSISAGLKLWKQWTARACRTTPPRRARRLHVALRSSRRCGRGHQRSSDSRGPDDGGDGPPEPAAASLPRSAFLPLRNAPHQYRTISALLATLAVLSLPGCSTFPALVGRHQVPIAAARVRRATPPRSHMRPRTLTVGGTLRCWGAADGTP
jgi:hypothetical protein